MPVISSSMPSPVIAEPKYTGWTCVAATCRRSSAAIVVDRQAVVQIAGQNLVVALGKQFAKRLVLQGERTNRAVR